MKSVIVKVTTMNKKYWTWYYENGKIKRDEYGVLGYKTKDELLNYLHWCL